MRIFAPLLLAAAAVAAPVAFDKVTVTKDFVAEGCAVADFHQDGKPDVAAGRHIWFGPDFKRRASYTPERDNPSGPNKTPYNPLTYS
ncbi:MAG: hypothetical protein ACKOIB_10540, partial [Verrucomicrobiota bacterium]